MKDSTIMTQNEKTQMGGGAAQNEKTREHNEVILMVLYVGRSKAGIMVGAGHMKEVHVDSGVEQREARMVAGLRQSEVTHMSVGVH
mmetsp:Transcript_42716/g.71025  ORF Transcript_42716/g.71025 Transcript_42716/m.71025 type:complete len:86 (+) Transcript_42716:84-341(+)